MSSNFLFNIDIVNKKYPNKIDIYEDAMKDMLKIKKNLNKFEKPNVKKRSSTEINSFEHKKKLMDIESSYKNSLFLLDIMQKTLEKNILEKYNLEKNNEIIQNALIKKNF